ncbi:MAG: M2 family metallopeptidase [Thermoanaerobaculia bacterium]|jgi:peptidyl-dipeptidase A
MKPISTLLVSGLAVAALLASACATSTQASVPVGLPAPVAHVAPDPPPAQPSQPAPPAPPKLTAADAVKFVADANVKLLALRQESNRASWVKANFITEDTQYLEAVAAERTINAGVDYAKKAFEFDSVEGIDPVTKRQLEMIKLGLTMPTPADPEKSRELTTIATRMDGMYGEGKYCPPGGGKCLDIEEISEILAKNRDPKRLREVWEGWQAVGAPMRNDYARFVALSNEGARELGFKDTGAMWRAKYDMPADDFARELDRLWGQVKPLYESLHCYVRTKLGEKYGTDAVPPNGPIPAHLLGNLWAQDWANIYDLVAPKNADPGYDITKLLTKKKVNQIEMFHYGERFFSSLGFDPLPKTFWERSLIVKPRDRNVICHASAWDIDEDNDLRIKMCTDVNEEDFRTIHHELGHNYYQRAYNKQPLVFRDSANDGFHEAIGDTIALSITPGYLVKVGLLKQEPDTSKDTGLLLSAALDKVAFLPFGLLVDQWRWKVFAGEITPAEYNKAWWDLKLKYQGVAPPSPRGEEYFDAGAKYHVPGNTPYSRYFLADILQYQFHRSLCEIAGQSGPLNRCSIYGNKEAGARLNAMLSMGVSRPWQDALETLSGKRDMDASAIVDYFAPLKAWLDEQNKGRSCGW